MGAGAGDRVVWKGLKPSETVEAALVDDFEKEQAWLMTMDSPVQTTIHFVEKSPAMSQVPFTDWSNYENNRDDKKREEIRQAQEKEQEKARIAAQLGPGAPDFAPDLESENNLSPVAPEAVFQRDVSYLNASAQLWKREQIADQKNAMEARIYFYRPGKDFVVISLPENLKNTKKGRPMAVSIWVYGYGKKHALYFLMSNSKHEAVPVRIGSLDYYGWRRLEAPVPASLQVKNPKKSYDYDFRIEGLKIVSHPKEERGTYLLVVDLFTVLIDHEKPDYPGSEIRDEWY